jgi:hypothetical protein
MAPEYPALADEFFLSLFSFSLPCAVDNVQTIWIHRGQRNTALAKGNYHGFGFTRSIRPSGTTPHNRQGLEW